jgi:hypothetical protein
MIELVKYFRILFLSKNLSRERLKDFCEDHIARLNANNPGGIFTPILTAITTAYNNYFGDLSSEALNQAVQEGKTIAMNNSRAALEKNISDNEKLIAYTYRNNPEIYEEFFPMGMKEYYDADLTTLETISLRFYNVFLSHAFDFPPAVIGENQMLQNTFVANRAEQMAAMSNVDAERSDLATTRPVLCQQLTVNLLTIALQYVGDESKADVYFDQTILNAAFKESERKVADDIDPGETQNVFDNITQPTVDLKGKNNGSQILYIGFKASPDEPATAEDAQMQPGEELTATAAEAGWTSTKKYLNITNPGTVAASYVVEKV